MIKVFDEIEFEDKKLGDVRNFLINSEFYSRAGKDMVCYFDNHILVGYIIRDLNQDKSIIGLSRKYEKFEELENGLLKII
jgi:hypothetical protein